MESEKDDYFMKALREGYRARSAYKVLQLARCFDLFKDVKNVIDLCAAPGSWSQVISNQLHGLKNITEPSKILLQPDVKIVAVDLAPIRPIPGVTSLVADITNIATCTKLTELFRDEKVDLIVCDGAHDVSGMVLADFQLHLGLMTACIHIVLQMLKDNGCFVAKIFDTWGCQIFVSQLKIFFQEVHAVKPHSSRSESYECFAVCKKYTKLKDFDPLQLTPYLNYTYRDFSSLTGIHKFYIPFLVLGHYDIDSNEFREIHEKYGDDLYEKRDLIQELFLKDELFDLKESLKEDAENVSKHKKFVNKLSSRGKFTFGVSKKLFIIHLNRDDTINFYKSINCKPPPAETKENPPTKEEATESNVEGDLPNDDTKFVTKLFDGFMLEENDHISNGAPHEIHPWFGERKIEVNHQEFEDLDLESVLARTTDEVMKVLKENNGNLPEDLDLSEKFLLLEDPNREVLKLVEGRRNLVEEIQKIIEENKL